MVFYIVNIIENLLEIYCHFGMQVKLLLYFLSKAWEQG